ncbi:MAG: TolC family protein [Gemmatimonadetes bacterium]|nr:TolC family protein [Gemmatimonadota bacterium]MXZ11306.1 TolC family protein [Gemmatimonadota bacterium]MYC15532.1 TolC family protein [Gemmatimonadota bacterium]
MYAIRAMIGLCLMGISFLPVRADELDLDGLIQEAVENNPNLSVLRARLAAFEAKIPQAGALEDPSFRFEVSNVPLSDFNLSSTPMSGNQFVVSQKFSFPGKQRARERSAQFASDSVAWLLRDRELVIANAIKQPFFDLAYVIRAIAIMEKNRVLLQDLVRIARTKYAVGKGLQQDVLKAQVSLSALDTELIALRAKKQLAETRLNLVLNRSPQGSLGAPPDTIGLSGVPLTIDVLLAQADERHPSLKAMDQSILMWRAEVEVARRNVWPDMTVSLGYRQRVFAANDPVKGSDFISVGIGIPLPVFGGRKQRQQIAEARANLREVEAQKAAERQEIHYEIQRLIIEVRQHRESAELFRSAMLPQAEQSLASALSGYRVDKVDFLTLLNNQVTLLNFEIAHYRHVIEHEKRVADLAAAVGH